MTALRSELWPHVKGDLGDSVYERALGVCISIPIETVLLREALFEGCVLARNLRVGTQVVSKSDRPQPLRCADGEEPLPLRISSATPDRTKRSQQVRRVKSWIRPRIADDSYWLGRQFEQCPDDSNDLRAMCSVDLKGARETTTQAMAPHCRKLYTPSPARRVAINPWTTTTRLFPQTTMRDAGSASRCFPAGWSLWHRIQARLFGRF